MAEIREVAVLKRCIADLKNLWETPDLESYFRLNLQVCSLQVY